MESLSPIIEARQQPRRRAFTLAESLIASVILAAAVLAIGETLNASAQHAAASQQQATAISLARQLLEEIAAKPFDDPDSDESGTIPRSAFDDVHDYAGYTDFSDALAPLGGSAVNVGGGTRFTRTVTIQAQKPSLATPAPTNDFALVTVAVTTPGGKGVKLSKLMTRTTVVME